MAAAIQAVATAEKKGFSGLLNKEYWERDQEKESAGLKGKLAAKQRFIFHQVDAAAGDRCRAGGIGVAFHG